MPSLAFYADCRPIKILIRRLSSLLTIKDVGVNLFLAIFVIEESMNDVWDRSPWSFDKKLILLKHFNGDLSPGNMTFQHSPF